MKVVMYHYVKDAQVANGHSAFLRLDDFRKQLDHFEEVGNIVHPNDLLENDFTPGQHDFLLTFDDGLSDHYHFVFPELQKRNLSGIFFLNGANYANCKLLNVHRLHYLLANYYDQHFEEHCLRLIQSFPLNDQYRNRFETKVYEGLQHESIIADIKSALNFFLFIDDQDKLLNSLMEIYQVDEASVAREYYITQEQVRIMAENGMCFGAHGFTHYVLSNLAADRQQQEIADSLSFVESILPDKSVSFFCYPYGYRESFNDTTLEMVKKAGFTMAFSVENREVTENDWLHYPLHLPRIDCNRFL